METATAPKVRLVRCPKCLLVLPEVADFPVYKCGGCDTILVAKNKKAIAKSTSVLQETGAAVTKPVRLLERGESSGSALQEPLPSPSVSRSSHKSGGNRDISAGSCGEKHGEDLLVEGRHNGRYEKDRNASRYGNGDGESDGDMLNESGSNEGKQNGNGLLPAESLGRYEKDRNTSGESDGESDRGMLDESRSNEGQQNGTGLLRTESLDRYEKDRNTSGYSDGNGEHDHDILDESRSTEGQQNGTGLLRTESLDRYEKDQNTSGYSDDDDGEPDRDMLDVSRSNEGKQNGTGLLWRESLGCYEKDQNTFRDSDGDGESDHGMLDENRLNEGQQNGTGLLQTESFEHCDVQQPGVPAEDSLSTELHHGNVDLMLEISTDSHSEEHDENLSVEGQHNGRYEKDKNTSRDSDGDGESDCDMLDENQSNEEPMLAAETNIEAEANGTTSQLEGVNLELETSNKIDSNPGGSWIGEHCGVTSARSTDTFQTVDFVSLCSEFSGPPECLSKSTTVRSSHAYDGSISSYDGIDDHFSDQQLRSFENSYKPANKKHYEMEKYGKWHRDEPLEPVMHHRPPRSWPRLERYQYASLVPLSQRTPLRDYGSAGPSRESRDEFPFDSPSLPFEKAEHSEEEKMKLLRMVYELQDQLSMTNLSASTDVPWKEKHYNKHREPLEDENFYPAYYGERGFNRRSRFSRVPFSGGAINNRHGIENTCLCCHPQAWNHPEQFPPPMFPQNRGFCRVGPGHNCYNSYSSLPCSPQRYMESDFSNRVHETQSDDQRYADHELKRYLREKHHLARRHIRPTAGGAPFVTCYHCIRPLQLPADFLLFRRRYHQLRCGACSKVLKFSLLKGTHIVPYELVAAEPPPSEVEDCNDAINARIPASASSSHGRTQTDPLSYSDDYGLSFDISCSTDGNPGSHARFHHLQGSNADVQNMSSSSSKPMETFDSARHSRSKKVSSETEGSPSRTGGSTLHRLMGYSSISQVLRGRRPSISSTSSSHFGKNNSGSNSRAQ